MDDREYLETERQRQAKDLVHAGLTYKQAAIMMGLSGPAVYYLCNSHKRREAARKYWQNRQLAKNDENFTKSIVTNGTNHANGALGEPSGEASLPHSDDPSRDSNAVLVSSGDSPIPR